MSETPNRLQRRWWLEFGLVAAIAVLLAFCGWLTNIVQTVRHREWFLTRDLPHVAEIQAAAPGAITLNKGNQNRLPLTWRMLGAKSVSRIEINPQTYESYKLDIERFIPEANIELNASLPRMELAPNHAGYAN